METSINQIKDQILIARQNDLEESKTSLSQSFEQ